jgi:hypothetical protein
MWLGVHHVRYTLLTFWGLISFLQKPPIFIEYFRILHFKRFGLQLLPACCVYQLRTNYENEGGQKKLDPKKTLLGHLQTWKVLFCICLCTKKEWLSGISFFLSSFILKVLRMLKQLGDRPPGLLWPLRPLHCDI